MHCCAWKDTSLPQLPLAPEEAAREEQEAAEATARAARAAYERDQGVLRALRQSLREVTYRLIADRRWATFVQPVEDPEYWAKVGEVFVCGCVCHA